MCVHAAKVSQASGKGAGQVSQVFKCVVVSPDNISCAWPRVCTGWCCRTPCHLSQSCETGDGGDSQQIIQTIPPSTSATLIMILTMHRSEDLMRDVHGERHDVAGAPPRGPCTRKQTSSKVDFLNFHTKRVPACIRMPCLKKEELFRCGRRLAGACPHTKELICGSAFACNL